MSDNVHSFETEDDLLAFLYKKGKFKPIQFVLLSSMIIPVGMADLSSIFFNLDPTTFRLAPEENSTDFNLLKSAGTCIQLNRSLGDVSYFYHSTKEWSIIGDMDLICGSFWMVAFSTIIFFLGQMLSNPFIGWFADRYGRRPTLLYSNILYSAVSVGLVFSKDYVSYAILRFVFGAARQGINNSFFVLLLESELPRNRTRTSAFVQFLYFCGGLVLGLVAYLVQNWHYIQAAMACANLPALGLLWFAPESLRWLLMTNRVQEAKNACVRIARFNGIDISERQLEIDIKRMATAKSVDFVKTHHYTLLDCFRTPSIRIFSLVIMMIWSAIQIVNYGIAFVLSNVFGNIYVSFAISQFLCLLPQGINIYLTMIFKNRISLICYLVGGGSCLLVAGAIPGDSAADRMAVQAFTIIGRMLVVGGHASAMTLSADLFPTIIRINGMSLVNISLRIGSIAAVPLALTADDKVYHVYKGMPFLVMAACCFVAAAGTSILPETKGMKMLTSIQEAEEFGRRELFSLPKSVLPKYRSATHAEVSEMENSARPGSKKCVHGW